MRREKPRKKDLTQGNTLNIINREGAFKGLARLLERRPSAYLKDSLPYVKSEKTNPIQDDTLEIWSFERWLVEWVEHGYYRAGDRSAIEVHYFCTLSTNFPSFDEPMYSEYDTSGRYIFTEDAGVLSLGGTYQTGAFKALKAVQKKFKGEFVIWTHSPIHIKEQFEIYNIGRILEFLTTDTTYGDAVIEYLYEKGESVDDYIILSGDSEVTGLPNVFQCQSGLKTKPK